MKKMHPKTGSPLVRIIIMMVVSLLCAAVLLVVPAKFEHLYAEETVPAFKLPVILGSAAKDNINEMTKPVLREKITVSIHADNELRFMSVTGGTVADVLKAAGIVVGKADICSPGLNTELVDGLKITISRVTYEEVVTKESIAFKTVNQNDSTMFKGTTKVARAGVKGERTIVTRVMRINGKLVSSQVVSDSVTKEPVSKLVKVGTKKRGAAPFYGLDDLILKQQKYVGTGPKPGTLHWRASVSGNTITDQFGNKVKFVKKITGLCSAYYTKGEITSKGYPCQYGIVAVNPKEIPYGTKMFICSPDGSFVYGYCVAGDTGGFINFKPKRVVDLRFNSRGQCWDFFGVRNMCIYILE